MRLGNLQSPVHDAEILESNYDTVDAVRPIKISAILRIYKIYELGFTVLWWDILLIALSLRNFCWIFSIIMMGPYI